MPDQSVDWSVVATFALLWAAVVPMPGANSLMVMHLALTRPSKHLAVAVAGNVAGMLLLALAALFGLAIMLDMFGWLRTAVNVLGGIYLVYLGIRVLRHSRKVSTTVPIAEAATPESDVPLAHSLGLGFLTSISNAQAVVFVTSMLALGGALKSTLATGLSCVGVIVLFNALYLTFLGWLLRRPLARAVYLRFRAALETAFGVLFIGLGGRLIWSGLARPLLLAR